MKLKYMANITGTISAAILASSCCIGQLILAGLGIGSIGIFSSLEKYRSLFMFITFAFIGIAFYLSYRRKMDVDACCGFKRDRFKKIRLWAITAIAVGLLLFPYVYGAFSKSPAEVPISDNLQQVVIEIKGMTCEACAQSINSAISKIQGVNAINISLEKGEAVVGFDNNVKDIPKNRLLAALENIGYKPSIASKEHIFTEED